MKIYLKISTMKTVFNISFDNFVAYKNAIFFPSLIKKNTNL